MGLFGPEWKSKKTEKRMNWVREADPGIRKNQEIFVEIADNDSDDDIKLEALKKITDQAVLTSYARSSFWEERIPAVSCLTDIDTLTRIEKHDDNDEVRDAAKKRLQSITKNPIQSEIPPLFKPDYKSKNDYSIIQWILSANTETPENQRILYKINEDVSVAAISETAISKIMDPQLLSKIIKGEFISLYYKEVLYNLTDQTVLSQFMIDYDAGDYYYPDDEIYEDILYPAMDKITDKLLLKKIADNANDADILEYVNSKLSDNGKESGSASTEEIQEKILMLFSNKIDKLLKTDFKAIGDYLDSGFDINSKDAEGKTILHYACSLLSLTQGLHVMGYQKPIEYLLEQGANPNIKDEEGNTPLHHLYWFGTENSEDMEQLVAILETFQKYNANFRITNNDGENISEYANVMGHWKMSEILEGYVS